MIVPQLFEIVRDSLEKELFSNATFFGERLLCENSSEDFKFLVGKAYIGKIITIIYFLH
jgi:hypothetical protein